jgi:hypothetical protein
MEIIASLSFVEKEGNNAPKVDRTLQFMQLSLMNRLSKGRKEIEQKVVEKLERIW